MTPMHPHWQSTEDEQIVPVRSKNAAPRQAIRVSRAPAAVVGITLMLAVVAYSYGGLGAIIGQLTNPTPDVTVHIKQSGPEPAIATIMPGQTIRWINEDQIPHVLTAETLPTQDGKPFSTPGMFPGSDAFYTAPLGSPEGTYDYISQTSPDVAGQIVLSNTPVAATSSSSLSSTTTSLPPMQTSSAPAVGQTSSAVPLPSQSSSLAPIPVGANVIAVNTHVVGAKSSSSKKPGVTEHKPTKQTASGPAVWIVLACSVAALVAATKGAFRKV